MLRGHSVSVNHDCSEANPIDPERKAFLEAAFGENTYNVVDRMKAAVEVCHPFFPVTTASPVLVVLFCWCLCGSWSLLPACNSGSTDSSCCYCNHRDGWAARWWGCVPSTGVWNGLHTEHRHANMGICWSRKNITRCNNDENGHGE